MSVCTRRANACACGDCAVVGRTLPSPSLCAVSGKETRAFLTRKWSARLEINSAGSGPLISALYQVCTHALPRKCHVVRITSKRAASSSQTVQAARLCPPLNPRAIQFAAPAEPPPLLQLEASSRVTFNDGHRVFLPHQGTPTPSLPVPSRVGNSLSLCARMLQFRGERLKHASGCWIAPCPSPPPCDGEW